MAVAVAVIVIVLVSMIVAALVNGNDAVSVIDAVDDLRSSAGIRRASGSGACSRCRAYPAVASSLTVSITPTVSFPFTSAATIMGTITITATATATATGIAPMAAGIANLPGERDR